MRARVFSSMTCSLSLRGVPPVAPAVLLGLGLAFGLVLGLAGCAKKPPKAEPPPEPARVSVPRPPERPMPSTEHELLSAIKKTGLDAEEVEQGLLIYLPTLYLFEFDRAEVDPETRRRIRQVATLLDSPVAAGRKLIVEGHTDALGSRAYNQKLSERRAEAVIHELASAGVTRTRITLRAFGKDKPLAPNRNSDGSDNPEGRAKNRRVALLIENPPATAAKP
jgi:outer membrane protein OmpA-like peptidoglycan-associated protein